MRFWLCFCGTVVAIMTIATVVLGVVFGPRVLGISAGIEGVVIVIYCLTGFYAVKQQTKVVIERWGEYLRIDGPGLHWAWPMMDRIAKTLNLRVQEMPLDPMETKTKDDVFTTIKMSLQYVVPEEKVKDAYLKLQDVDQIRVFVYNAVRAFAASVDLDTLFERQRDLEVEVKKVIDDKMAEYGYDLVAILVVDIDPAAVVKEQKNKRKALELAAVNAEREGEANKIRIVKEAEAGAEAKRLAGKGIADERLEIARGIHDAREKVKEGSKELDDGGVMKMLLLTQYLDTLEAFSKAEGTKTILIPHSPGGFTDFERQLERAVLVGNELGGHNDFGGRRDHA